MDTQRVAGIGLVIAGLAGYIAGIYVVYPGRSLSITALMVGIAIAAISRQHGTEELS